MHLADLGVVFDADVKPRMQPIYKRRAHRGPVDLP
jgi:hypothetical protein